MKDLKGQPSVRYFSSKNSDVNFRELRPCNATSPRRKGMPARPQRINKEGCVLLKRGSVYISSSEVRRVRKLKEGRTMDSANNNDAFVSFNIDDSSSWIRRDDAILVYEKSRSPLGSLNAELKSRSVNSTQSLSAISTEYLELSFHDLPEKHLNVSASCSGRALINNSSVESLFEFCSHMEETELPCAKEASRLVTRVDKGHVESNCNKMLGPENGEILYGRDFMHVIPKSYSAMTGMPDSHYQSEKEILKPTSKMRFSPTKRMVNPIMKPKSLSIPSLTEAEMAGRTDTDLASISRDGSFHNSLLNDFSKTAQKMEPDSWLIVRDQVSSTASSPAHLHGILKFEFKHQAPTFEFVVKAPEDILSAKAWSTDSEFNWAYTFHSCKKKVSRTGRSAKERRLQSLPIIGQMQLSCFICSEVGENGSLDNYMATESILYDFTQARRGISIEERSNCPSDSIRPPPVTVSESLFTESSFVTHSSVETENEQHRVRYNSTECDSVPSTSYPWSREDLHPHLESAATLIQIPFNKESLEVKEKEKIGTEGHSNLSSFSFHNGRSANSSCLNTAVVKVVIPCGTHGLPTTSEGGPSTLLDRWKFGGGCDCGGWDMACPLIVLDNPCGNMFGYSMMGNQQPILLFFQGRKEKIPALSITADGEGRYSVHFHAQLSTLQAFSICVAILHSSAASPAAGQEKNKHKLYSDSLKLVLEQEVKHLIEAVAEEKINAKKKVVQTPAFFVFDPLFSPMGRV